jgi:hypothetical protein
MTLVVVPCAPVERAHVKEAWRALIGQGVGQGAGERAFVDGGEAVDAAVTQLLWLARALPVVVDVLADAGAGVDLGSVRFGDAVFVDVSAAPARTPLSCVAWRRDDELCVEVLFVPTQAVADGSVVDDAFAHLLVPFALAPHTSLPPVSDDDEVTAEDYKIARPEAENTDPVRLRRFHVGKN